MHKHTLPSLAAFAAVMALGPAVAQAAEVQTELVSRASGFDGAPSESFSSQPSVSQDGRFVAFVSQGNALSASDDNAHANLFVRDRATGATELVSIGMGGAPANASAEDPRITPDGRFVAYWSTATNLAPTDANGGAPDVFVYDRQTGTTTHVSRADGHGGAGADAAALEPSITADGTKVAFASMATNLSNADGDALSDVFVRDLAAGQTRLVSVDAVAANGHSAQPDISGDGTDVAFVSEASNLDGGGAPGILDVFVRNLVSDSTTLVSRPTGFNAVVGDDESLLPAISHSGRYVAFQTKAANLVDTDVDAVEWRILRRDLLTGQTVLASRATGVNGAPNAEPAVTPAISSDGGTVSFETAAQLDPAAQPGIANVYTRAIVSGTTTLMSRASGPAGAGVNAATFSHGLSGDGQTLAFATSASNLTGVDAGGIDDVFVRGLPIAPIAPPQGGGGGGQQQPEAPQEPVAPPAAEQPAPPAVTPTPVPPVVSTPAAPKLRMQLVRLKGRKAQVRVTCLAGDCRGTLRVKRAGGKGTALGRVRFDVAPGTRQTVTVRLKRRVARPKLRGVATVRGAGASRTVVEKTLRVKTR